MAIEIKIEREREAWLVAALSLANGEGGKAEKWEGGLGLSQQVALHIAIQWGRQALLAAARAGTVLPSVMARPGALYQKGEGNGKGDEEDEEVEERMLACEPASMVGGSRRKEGDVAILCFH